MTGVQTCALPICKIAELKPMNSDEKAASVILILSILLWITGSYTGLKPYTVAALAFCAMFLKGIFTMKDFQDMVPWGGLITLVASLLSISALLGVVGSITGWQVWPHLSLSGSCPMYMCSSFFCA